MLPFLVWVISALYAVSVDNENELGHSKGVADSADKFFG